MANADPTRSILHAVRVLAPARPTMARGKRLTRFFLSVVISLLVVNLALTLLLAVGASHTLMLLLCIGWMFVLCGGAPIVIFLAGRDQETHRRHLREWESDSRRLAMERLGLDLSASRMPTGLAVNDLFALDHASCDWLLSRDALDALSWARGDLAKTRDELRFRLDEAMANLLAEAGAGHDLGPSPFVIERARSLFVEVGLEAQTLTHTQSPLVRLTTDSSLESLRNSLDQLRDVRVARSNLVECLFETISADGKALP
jgi:hypothetical protein